MYHFLCHLEERMQYAWAAYKERWAREEDHLKNLEEQKKVGIITRNSDLSTAQKWSLSKAGKNTTRFIQL